MKKSSTRTNRLPLGAVTRSTHGGIRGVVEPFGLYTAAIRLD